MLSILPAASSADATGERARPILVAALSGRALAASARRAGFRPLALDLFGDCDTLCLAPGSERVAGDLARGFDPGALIAAVERSVRAFGGDLAGLAYGAGFEDRPALLAALAERVQLVGNSAASVAAVKDPRRFFGTLAELAIDHPETRIVRPGTGVGWLAKRIGASGGGHVRPTAQAPGDGATYFQRRVSGRAVGVSFLADGREAQIVGCAEQWSSTGAEGAAFRYGGAVQPARLPAGAAEACARAIRALVPRFALRGLNSADFLVREDGVDLIEINPRPGASLDLFDRAAGRQLFARHVEACEGRLGPEVPPAAAAAAGVVYAETALAIPAGLSWPDWAADIPQPGSTIEPGAPLCTVRAEAAEAETARAAVAARGRAILRSLAERAPAAPAVAP